MSVTGTPTNIEEFIDHYKKGRCNEVRGMMGQEIGGIPRGIRILDVGCGIGNILFALHANGFRNIYGLDIERQLVEYARKNVPNANLVVANAEHIPFSRQAFDCVVCYDLLEHVLKPKKVLAEISRVLKQGGTLYMTAANGYSVNDIVFRWGGRILRGRSSHVQKFMKGQVEKILRECGFEIERISEIKGCVFNDLPITAKVPFSAYLRKIASKVGKYMSYGWEFKAVKHAVSKL